MELKIEKSLTLDITKEADRIALECLIEEYFTNKYDNIVVNSKGHDPGMFTVYISKKEEMK